MFITVTAFETRGGDHRFTVTHTINTDDILYISEKYICASKGKESILLYVEEDTADKIRALLKAEIIE